MHDHLPWLDDASTVAGGADAVNDPAAAESAAGGNYPSPVASRAVPAPLTQLPNALTIGRLLLIPVFVVLMLRADGGQSVAAGLIFWIAGITDQVDGFLARRWHAESAFGKVADPLADRLMIDAAVIFLWLDDRLPWIALALILLRDVVLLAGYRVLAPRGVEIDVNTLGKVATWVLYASLGLIMLTEPGTDWPLWLFWIGLGMAVAAGAGYVTTAWRMLKEPA